MAKRYGRKNPDSTGYVCTCCGQDIDYDVDFAKFENGNIICGDCYASVSFRHFVETAGGEVCNMDFYDEYDYYDED